MLLRPGRSSNLRPNDYLGRRCEERCQTPFGVTGSAGGVEVDPGYCRLPTRRRCYPARLLAVMTMKSAITISLTIHEFVFIQSRAFGKKACAR
jgi:hypothetical protein